MTLSNAVLLPCTPSTHQEREYKSSQPMQQIQTNVNSSTRDIEHFIAFGQISSEGFRDLLALRPMWPVNFLSYKKSFCFIGVQVGELIMRLYSLSCSTTAFWLCQKPRQVMYCQCLKRLCLYNLERKYLEEVPFRSGRLNPTQSSRNGWGDICTCLVSKMKGSSRILTQVRVKANSDDLSGDFEK